MLASQVISSTRRLIGDINAAKWESSDLLDALNNAQTELIRNTALLKTSGKLFIEADVNMYSLPSDCFILTRGVYSDKVIETKKMSTLDDTEPEWLTETSETDLELLIKDSVNQQQIMTYPLLTNPSNPYIVNGVWGPITEIQGITIAGGVFGAITDITDTEVDNPIINREDEYGALTDIKDAFITVTLYYIKKPITLTEENDELEVDSNYKMFLVYKTAAELLMYDENTENINKSELLNNKAIKILEEIGSDVKLDYIIERDVDFRYQGGID